MVWVGRGLKGHLVLCHGQGHLPLDQVAPIPIQPGLAQPQALCAACSSVSPAQPHGLLGVVLGSRVALWASAPPHEERSLPKHQASPTPHVPYMRQSRLSGRMMPE